MAITRGIDVLLAEANAVIRTIATDEAVGLHADGSVTFVDIRDPRELERDGMVPGALHATRGMLEFWVDPASPYHKPLFADETREFVLFCGAGWRSALAAKSLQDMGMTNVAHVDGGWAKWTAVRAPIESLEDNKARRKGAA